MNINIRSTTQAMGAVLPQMTLVVSLSASVVGCATTGPAVTSYGASAQCEVAEAPSAVLVNASKGKNFAADKSFTIALKPSDTPKKPSKYFNLDEHWLVRVAMGEKPTSGYGLKLESEMMSVVDGVGTLSLNWEKPEEGTMLPQVLTYPCIYLQIEKGDYSKIRIIDQAQKEHFTIDMPHKAEK